MVNSQLQVRYSSVQVVYFKHVYDMQEIYSGTSVEYRVNCLSVVLYASTSLSTPKAQFLMLNNLCFEKRINNSALYILNNFNGGSCLELQLTTVKPYTVTSLTSLHIETGVGVNLFKH